MFSLHETTRIRLCRVAFFALCLGPTCAVAAWCLAVHQPSYRHWHEQAISERLGWPAQLERVSLPRPGVVLYEGLQLTDPESGQLLAQAPFVELDTRGDAVAIRLPFPAKVNGRRIEALLTALERQLRAADENGPLTIDAPNVTLHLADGDQTLVDVAGLLERTPDQARMKLRFRLAEANSQKTTASTTMAPAELTVTRRGGSPPTVVIECNTGTAALPCSLLASSWPSAQQLGKASTFRGSIGAVREHGAWQLNLQGRLAAIDLELLASPFPHKLTGPAEVELARVTIRGGRVEAATGKLTAGPGIVSRSLIQAAQANLHLGASPQAMTGRDNRMSYRQLALAFEIDGNGLALRGDVADARGALLVDDKHVLLQQATLERQPVVNLLRTLVPQSAVQVPATRETSGLAGFLPVPPVVPPPGSEEPLPQARALRLAPK